MNHMYFRRGSHRVGALIKQFAGTNRLLNKLLQSYFRSGSARRVKGAVVCSGAYWYTIRAIANKVLLNPPKVD